MSDSLNDQSPVEQIMALADEYAAIEARSDIYETLRAAVEQIVRENAALRDVVSASVSALGNGAFCSPKCSLEFMQQAPKEVEMGVGILRRERDEARALLRDVRANIEGLNLYRFIELRDRIDAFLKEKQ